MIKKIFIRSGKPIEAKIISVGKNENNKDDSKAVSLLAVISSVNLYVRKIFKIENINGKKIVANSLTLKIFIDIAFIAINPILSGNTG